MAFASTNTIDFQYDSFKRVLTVYFSSGNKFNYHGVPYDKYANLLESKSKGEYFSNHIKSVYKSEKIY